MEIRHTVCITRVQVHALILIQRMLKALVQIVTTSVHPASTWNNKQ